MTDAPRLPLTGRVVGHRYIVLDPEPPDGPYPPPEGQPDPVVIPPRPPRP